MSRFRYPGFDSSTTRHLVRRVRRRDELVTACRRTMKECSGSLGETVQYPLHSIHSMRPIVCMEQWLSSSNKTTARVLLFSVSALNPEEPHAMIIILQVDDLSRQRYNTCTENYDNLTHNDSAHLR